MFLLSFQGIPAIFILLAKSFILWTTILFATADPAALTVKPKMVPVSLEAV